jgi:hypothetical protein
VEQCAKFGYFELAKWGHENKCRVSPEAIGAASEHVDAIPFLEWIHHVLDGNDSLLSAALRPAAAHGHVETLEWLLEKEIPWKPTVLIDAASAGHLHVLQWAKEKKLVLPPLNSMGQCALSGNLEVLRWVRDNHYWLNYCFIWAAKKGHVHVLEWLAGERVRPDEMELQSCYFLAGEEGHVAVLEWMEGQGWMTREAAYVEVYQKAARRGQIEVLRWMRERQHPGMEGVCKEGARYGMLEVVKWGREEGGPWDQQKADEMMRAAVDGGSLEVMKWVQEQGGRIYPGFYHTIFFFSSYNVGVDEIPKIFDFFENSGCPLPSFCWQEVWEHSLKFECLNMLEWLSLRDPLLPCFWEISVCSSSLGSLKWLKSKGCPRKKGKNFFVLARDVKVHEWLRGEGFVEGD